MSEDEIGPTHERTWMKPIRFPHVGALDGVRGLAALAVIVHHGLAADAREVPWGSVWGVCHGIASYGYLGVDLFFVLSGYLITTLLLLARRSPTYYQDFYWKRVFRILPALLLVLALLRLVFHAPWSGILVALFFLNNLVVFWNMPAVGPFWSLATEEQFYLLWPAVVRRLRPRQMMRLLLVLALGLEAVRTVAALRGAGRMQYSPLHCDGLAWGAMVALVALRARVPFRVEGGARLWNDLGRWMLLAGAAAMAVALALRMVGANDLGLPVTAAGPLFGGLLLYVLSHPKGVVGLCLSWGPLRMLGAISYMAYLSHPYMMELFDRYIGPRMATHGVDYLWTRLIAAFAATLLWSLLTLYAWERPLGRLRRYFVAAA